MIDMRAQIEWERGGDAQLVRLADTFGQDAVFLPYVTDIVDGLLGEVAPRSHRFEKCRNQLLSNFFKSSASSVR